MERKTKIMALAPLSPLDIYSHMIDGNIVPQTNNHIIRGTPVVVDYMIDELSATKASFSDEDIKLNLCHLIAGELYRQNMIEFTKEVTAIGNVHCRARIFAVPNSDVQLLRLQEIIK
jgi:hypothetical protein